MSGHSKWSKVKHQKAVTDVVKAAAFTKASKGITVAVTEGGGPDPDSNFKLRLAIEKAKAVNMPAENIKRAIDKGSGASAGTLRQETYEGYGPYGVAFLVEVTTDNPNRSVSYIKQVLEHAGGSMGSPGCVAYLFKRVGLLIVMTDMSYDTLLDIAITAGAEDIIAVDGGYEIQADPMHMQSVRDQLIAAKLPPVSVELAMIPVSTIDPDVSERAALDVLIDRLSESDDVQEVFTNLA
jgi:YebC/PmpR family DNA-binding regulatory protein